jgi:hypothetical protein
MARQNCWEFKNCGRQPGGAKTADLGLCPAATEPRLNGVNSGRNGGRSCWAMTGTLCGGAVQGTFAAKMGNCTKCEFYKIVNKEEGASVTPSLQILARLR